MNSNIIFIAVILFSMAINGCKEEKQEDLTIGLVGTYSGEFTWIATGKKENGIITIKRIDETHIEITDNLGLLHFDFMEVSKKDQNGDISFVQIVVSPLYGNLPDGILTWGSMNENKVSIHYYALNFVGYFIQ